MIDSQPTGPRTLLGFAIYLVIGVGCLAAVTWALYEIGSYVTRRRKSRRPVPGLPEDGEYLDDQEAWQWAVIRHGWALSAREPRHARRGR